MSNRKSSGSELNPECKPKRIHKPFWDYAYLELEYLVKKRSAYDIASEWGVTEGNVLYWLHKNNVPRRDTRETRKIKYWGVKGIDNPMFGRCGSDNPNWIDGSSPERQSNYARSFWKEIAKEILERDGYKCVRCGALHSGKNKLHAHHLKSWAGHKDDRFELANIITVCQRCHSWIHSKENVNSEYILP